MTPLDEEELRDLVREAHADDAPPPFAPRRRGRRRPRWVPLAAVAAVAGAAVAWLALRSRPAPTVSVAELEIHVSYPLDFLLDVPGGEVLRTTPRFDAKEGWP